MTMSSGCMGDVDMGTVKGRRRPGLGCRQQQISGRNLGRMGSQSRLPPPEIIEAMEAQFSKIDYVSPVFEDEARTAYAKKLAELAGALSKVLYGLSGSIGRGRAMHLAIPDDGWD